MFYFKAESLIVSMFCTGDSQIYPKDVFLRDSSFRQLIAIKIPFYFFVTRVIELKFSMKKNRSHCLSIFFTNQDKHSEFTHHSIRTSKTLNASKTDLFDGLEENTSMKNSRIRIQLPKLETLDASGLIPQANHQDQQTNGFLFDSELGDCVVYSDYLTGKTMADFVGVNGLEKNVVEAIMNFSYNLTLGDLDAAFRAIKAIKK